MTAWEDLHSELSNTESELEKLKEGAA
jgi:hypothetical protein